MGYKQDVNHLLINGVSYDWASVTIMIGVQPLMGISSITYNETQNISPVYNNNMFAIGFGFGKVTTTVSLVIDLDELDILRYSANEMRLQNLPLFDIQVVYINSDDNMPIYQVIKHCKIISTNINAAQNNPNITAELSIVASHIETFLEDFVSKVDNTLDVVQGTIHKIKHKQPVITE